MKGLLTIHYARLKSMLTTVMMRMLDGHVVRAERVVDFDSQPLKLCGAEKLLVAYPL